MRILYCIVKNIIFKQYTVPKISLIVEKFTKQFWWSSLVAKVGEKMKCASISVAIK